MKLRITNGPGRVVLILLIAISIACSVSKSSTSPPAQVAGNQGTSQSSTPVKTPVAAPPTQQRTPCTLTLSLAPAINRLKLGMTVDEILAVFPGSKEDPELRSVLAAPRGPLGNFSFLITPSKYGETPEFKGISRLNFTLLDGRVSTYTISYDGPQWPDVDKFVEWFIANTDLPKADQWEPYAGLETQMKTVTCAGFLVRVFSGGEGGSQNYVLVQDIEADKKLKERRRKAREQASPTPETGRN